MRKFSMLLLALAILSSAYAVSAAESNAISPDTAGTQNAVYTVNLPARTTCPYGDDCIIWRQGNALMGIIPNDKDTYNIVVSGTRTVTVLVVDCCMMGDTMRLSGGGTSVQATSPNVIFGQKRLAAGTYSVVVGYAAAPGGFPAEYAIAISGE